MKEVEIKNYYKIKEKVKEEAKNEFTQKQLDITEGQGDCIEDNINLIGNYYYQKETGFYLKTLGKFIRGKKISFKDVKNINLWKFVDLAKFCSGIFNSLHLPYLSDFIICCEEYLVKYYQVDIDFLIREYKKIIEGTYTWKKEIFNDNCSLETYTLEQLYLIKNNLGVFDYKTNTIIPSYQISTNKTSLESYNEVKDRVIDFLNNNKNETNISEQFKDNFIEEEDITEEERLKRLIDKLNKINAEAEAKGLIDRNTIIEKDFEEY